MKTLDESNDEVWKVYERNAPYPNGIECPKCGAELMDSDNMILTSSPPQRNIHCPKCGYRGYRLV